MEVPELRDLVRDFTVVGKPCSPAEMVQIRKLVDVLVAALRRKAEDLIPGVVPAHACWHMAATGGLGRSKA